MVCVCGVLVGLIVWFGVVFVCVECVGCGVCVFCVWGWCVCM